ncbi:MAG: MATE family efflux transporter, partial [Pseudomonadota bacterium]
MEHKLDAQHPGPRVGEVRHLLALAFPLIGGRLAQYAINVTDAVMMGWYSVEGLAALTLATAVFFVLFLMGTGFGVAVSAMVAGALGEG